MLTDQELKELQNRASEIRKLAISAMGNLGVGHIGGSMSIVDTLAILYEKHMHVTPDSHDEHDRNLLVFSKGHCGPALYAALSDQGFFPKEWLETLNQGGTRLPSHCDMNLTPGIDMTTGSLGQGLSAAVGMALANRFDGLDKNIFVILGDGECHEGQIWEAAMAAAHFDLNKIVGFVDYNKLGLDGYLSDIMELEDITAKWLAFGWNTTRINGHDFRALNQAIEEGKSSTDKPTMIILDTIKGKDCSFAEGLPGNHSMAFDMKMAEEAIQKLDNKA